MIDELKYWLFCIRNIFKSKIRQIQITANYCVSLSDINKSGINTKGGSFTFNGWQVSKHIDWIPEYITNDVYDLTLSKISSNYILKRILRHTGSVGAKNIINSDFKFNYDEYGFSKINGLYNLIIDFEITIESPMSYISMERNNISFETEPHPTVKTIQMVQFRRFYYDGVIYDVDKESDKISLIRAIKLNGLC